MKKNKSKKPIKVVNYSELSKIESYIFRESGVEINKKSKSPRVSDYRAIYFYLAVKFTSNTYKSIGDYTGHSHSLVMHHYNNYRGMRFKNKRAYLIGENFDPEILKSSFIDDYGVLPKFSKLTNDNKLIFELFLNSLLASQ